MLKRIGKLFNIKAWIESFLLKTVVNKGSKHATSTVVGLLGSAVFVSKVKPVLDQFGIVIDQTQLAAGLTVLFGGVAGWVNNWMIKVLDKDGDGQIG